MGYLEIHDQAGTRWLPAGQFLTIGRSLQNHVVLQGQTVSRNHARIVFQGNHVLLEDLGSTYGTMVNGLYVRGWKALQPEDRIQMGDALVIYHAGPEVSQYDRMTPPIGILRPIPSAELPRNMVRCPNCGTANLKTNSVCYNCGYALVVHHVRPSYRPTPLVPQTRSRTPVAMKPSRRRTTDRLGTIMLILLLILVLCLLSLVLVLLLAGGPLVSWLSRILVP